MRQVHRAGEKVFLDYSGAKPAYFDAELGQRVEVELGVAPTRACTLAGSGVPLPAPA